jgi:asparaginyl-tRNA synthetase
VSLSPSFGGTLKNVFVSDLLDATALGSAVDLYGWIKAKRVHGRRTFVDMVDSTGTMQAVFEHAHLSPELLAKLKATPVESAVLVSGVLAVSQRSGEREIHVKAMRVIGRADRVISPQPRGPIDIFDNSLVDQLMTNRHIYLRNPQVMAVLEFRHLMMGVVHQWFRDKRFIEITAPVLTALPLYDDGTAMNLTVHEQNVFLTQCVDSLESAVHAFERVYNMGPSFRREESRSKRHLMEYWHIKGELAFGNLEDIISLVEDLIQFVTLECSAVSQKIEATLETEFCLDGASPPFPRITYREAIAMLGQHGIEVPFGTSLGSEEEELLSTHFQNRPFWVVGIPRKIEPFPYVINPEDSEVTMTADLIASRGYGELLGVAEKTYDLAELDERMTEKGKFGRPEYEWLRELREAGCVPHIGFGLGVERFIRWLLQIPHVRDAMPFPRVFRRQIHP